MPDLLGKNVVQQMKDAVPAAKAFQRAMAAAERAVSQEDLYVLQRELASCVNILKGVSDAVHAALGELARLSFDPRSDSVAEYASSLEKECNQLGVRLRGHFPQYELFPISVSIDLMRRQAFIGDTKHTTLASKVLAKEIEKEHSRWMRSEFNSKRFLSALALVYDAITGNADGQPIPLRKVHAVLAARSGVTGPKGYSREQFAIDLYRVRAETNLQYEGRRFRFGQTRDTKNAVPVPTPAGGYENLSTLSVEKVETT